MAYLRKIKGSKYWIGGFNLPDGRRTQRSTKCEKRSDALKIVQQWEEPARNRATEAQFLKVISDVHEQIHGGPLHTPTVAGYVKQWCGLVRNEVKPGTVRSYESAASSFVAHLGEKANQPLHYTTVSQIIGWRDTSASQTSTRTANNRLKILRIMFQRAWRDNLMPDNPAQKVQTLVSISEKRRAFTMEELRKTVAVADAQWRGMIILAFYTGQRLGDIAKLRWRQIDSVNHVISFITTKTQRQVLLPLCEPIRTYLSTLPTSDIDAPVFPSACHTVETQGRVSSLSNQFAQLLVKAGLCQPRTHKKRLDGRGRSARRARSDLSFHNIRHTTTSELANNGVSEAVTRDIVGHECAAISRHYTHIQRDEKLKALQRLPDITTAA